jgi:tetratricopeptide (TPR) repeat protein
MSETHTTTFAGIKQTARGITLALTVGLTVTLAAFADGELTIKNVVSDANKQLVVQFATGQGAPQAPKLMEMPAPNHQLLIDFAGVSLDENSVPSGDQLSKLLAAQMPGVRAARVGVLANAESPTVRVALDLDPDLQIKPSIAQLQDGAAVISLGEGYGVVAAPPGASSTASASAGGAAAANDPAAAYEEYYRKFLQQKQMTDSQVPTGDWGPRKGTVAEAKGINGFRIIGTPVNSPVLADIPKTVEDVPVKAPAATPAPVAEQPAAMAEQPAAEPAPVTAEAPAPQPAETQPVAESAPTPGAQVAEASPAPAAQVAETPAAPTPKEEAPAQAQPDMVAGGEAASETAAPPVTASAAVPPARHVISKAPSPARAAVEETAHENESAASPADAAAASAGAAVVDIRTSKEQDKAENQPHVTSPADDAGNSAEPPKRKARRLFNDAVANHIHGHTTQAVALYKEALKIDPELGDAHSNLGLAYNQMHNYASALSEFHKALAVNPRDAITYNGVGAALRAEHDMPGAIKNWETAVKLDPKLAVAHYNLGTAYEGEGDFDRALVSYEEAVKIDSHLGEAYFRMGLILHKRHRLQDAKTNFKQALKISGDSDYSAEAREKLAAIDKLAK